MRYRQKLQLVHSCPSDGSWPFKDGPVLAGDRQKLTFAPHRIAMTGIDRELSTKVFRSQRLQARLGSKQGSTCPYGLRRQVVGDQGIHALWQRVHCAHELFILICRELALRTEFSQKLLIYIHIILRKIGFDLFVVGFANAPRLRPLRASIAVILLETLIRGVECQAEALMTAVAGEFAFREAWAWLALGANPWVLKDWQPNYLR